MIKTVVFNKSKNCLELINQTLLPIREEIFTCFSEKDVAKAIVGMIVRGAPAIGVAAAYGVYLGLTSKENLEQNERYSN